jgi:hypothetical protein
MTAVVSSVKVLALSNVKLCLNAVINLMKCFPHLDKLYIQVTFVPECVQAVHSSALIYSYNIDDWLL